MNLPSEAPLGEPIRKLHPGAKGVLIAWALLDVGMALLALIEARGDEGFDDQARFLGLFMPAISLVLVGVVALAIRRFIVGAWSQVLAAAVGPPILGALALLVLRVIG